MDFDWTEEQRALQKALKDRLDEALRDELEALEEADPAQLEATTRGLLRRLGGLGYLDAAEPMTLLAAQEELARVSGSAFLAVEASARLCAGLVAEHGGPQLADDILDPLLAGEAVGAVAASDEPEPGGSQVMARVQGDVFLLSGRKPFVTNGPFADWLAVVASVEGGDEAQGVFMLEAGSSGLLRGPRLATLGYRGLAVCSLELDQVQVPAERVLGPFAEPQALASLRAREDMILCLASVGLLERSYGAAKAHAAEHQRDGKPILRRQQVAFSLAEMLTQLQTAQWMSRRAAWLLATGGAEGHVLLRCAKVFASEAAERVASDAMQVLAGQGYRAGNAVERAYRDA